MSNRYNSLPILLVDDEDFALAALEKLLLISGFRNVVKMSDSTKVMPYLDENPVSVVLTDLSMPALCGQELLKMIVGRHPAVPVVVMTAASDLETALDCMKNGACDYLVKPLDKAKLFATLERAVELRSLNDEVLSLKESPQKDSLVNESHFLPIKTCNREMRQLFRYVEVIACSRQPVLITGETGTGKELFARTVHTVSRRTGAFVAVNVAGLDDMMFSDTLFGHKKGAFTGADTLREGLITKAENGSLFLDEIGDLTEASQTKLLRLLQEEEYYRLGTDVLSKSNARIVLATNRDLKKMMNEGRFRKDLYFRLRIHNIHVPPLRERLDDIPLLLDHFLATAAQSMGKKPPAFGRELVTLLSTYHFPGNVRELQAMVFDSVARCVSGKLGLQGFKELIQREREEISATPVSSSENTTAANGIVFDRFPTLKEAETELINRALALAAGNQGIAASMLGITRQALNNRLRRAG